MATETLDGVLRTIPLFTGMTDSSIAAIGEIVERTEFAAGTELIREGEPGDRFIVIVSGTARVEHDGSTVRFLGPGDFLGEISLIDRRPRTATVVATSPIDALTIDATAFGGLLDRHPAVRYSTLEALTERLRASAGSTLD